VIDDGGVLPGEPLPVRLMNTIWADRRGVRHDSIATAAELASWLQATDLAGPSTPVTAGDLAQARQLRDALRILAAVATASRQEAVPAAGAAATAHGAAATADGAAATAHGADGTASGAGTTAPGGGAGVADEGDLAAAVATVNAIAAGHSPPRIVSREGRLTADATPAGPPVAAGLALVAAQAIGLLTDPDSPLRACHGPGCVLYFSRDHPRREWCSAGCGNRARAARHYRRHRAGGSQPASEAPRLSR
jgi:predicted RNA-binding Zn ribbon-like protein